MLRPCQAAQGFTVGPPAWLFALEILRGPDSKVGITTACKVAAHCPHDKVRSTFMQALCDMVTPLEALAGAELVVQGRLLPFHLVDVLLIKLAAAVSGKLVHCDMWNQQSVWLIPD